MNGSKFLRLDFHDIGKGIVLAVITAVLTSLLTMLNENGLMFETADFQQIGTVALTAAIGYLTKNVFTNSNDEFGKGE